MNYRLRLVIRAVYLTWTLLLLAMKRVTFGGAMLAVLLFTAVGMHSALYSEVEKSRVRTTLSWLRAPDTGQNAKRARIALATLGAILVVLFGLQFTSYAFLSPRRTGYLCQVVVAYVLIGFALDWWTLSSGEPDARQGATD
jgi:hypothetical protein